MIKNFIKLFLFQPFLLFAIYSLLFPSPVSAAASLKLEPASSTVNINATFSVAVKIDTSTDLTGSTDLVLLFPPSLLQVQSITDGALYPTFVKNIDNTTGKLTATGAVSASDPSKYFQGIGTFATITFLAKAAGNASVTIDCTPSTTTDSNVVKKADSTDILNCNLVGNGSYTINSTGTVSPTATPTPGSSGSTAKYRCSGTACIRDDVAGTYASSSCDNACTTTALPQSGDEMPTIMLVFGGLTFVFISFKLLRASLL